LEHAVFGSGQVIYRNIVPFEIKTVRAGKLAEKHIR
jgi:hypothetical protein